MFINKYLKNKNNKNEIDAWKINTTAQQCYSKVKYSKFKRVK